MSTGEVQKDPNEAADLRRRRTRLLAAAGVAVVGAAAVAIWFVNAANSSSPGVNAAGIALAGVRSSEGLQLVRGHTKMQAYGPGWSQHRQRDIAPYLRSAAAS